LDRKTERETSRERSARRESAAHPLRESGVLMAMILDAVRIW
jgi:hypothetical protein